MPPDVSAVVVTWNSQRDIVNCINSLLMQSVKPAEIVVVDNASTDGTRDIVASNFPRVRLIALEENVGFASGNNIGISNTSGEWIVLLNPDAELTNDWIERLLEFAGDDVNIGALGGVLWRAATGKRERKIVDSMGIEIYSSRRVRDSGSGDPGTMLPTNPQRVFGICAAAAMFRRKMLIDVAIDGEIFPGRFFCYYEDADLAWRAWRRGWQAWTIPAAEGFHFRGGSPIGSSFSRYHTHRNRLWMILRNDAPKSIFRSLPAILAHEALMILRTLRYPILIEAVIESLAGIWKSLSERKLLSDTTVESPPFKSGIGFSRAEKINAITAKKNILY